MNSPVQRHPMSGPPTPEMVDAAIAWALRVHYSAPDMDTRQAFKGWLEADPRHVTAWARMQSIAGEMRDIPRDLALDTLAPRRLATDARQRQRRAALKCLGLASTVGMAAWLAGQHTPWQRLIADVSTVKGERRTITLADETSVTLNTDTAISSRFTESERDVYLYRGEIFVATGRDGQATRYRPFHVQTPFGTVQALGTRFLVRLDEDAVRVAVHEGAVELYPHRGPGRTVRAGERWRMYAEGEQAGRALAFEPSGWLEGVLVAREMPLGELLSELNRYRTGRLSADPGIADRTITGVYQLDDIDRTLHFLAQTHGWQLAYRSRYWVTVAPV